MSRGLVSGLLRVSREIQRQEVARQRAELRAARAAERDHKAAVKDVQRRFHEAQMEEARRLTDLAKEQIRSLENLLIQSLDRDSRVDPAVFRREPPAPPLPLSEPTLEDFLPPRPSFFTRLMPGSSARHAKEVADAHDKYVAAISEHHAKSTDQYSAWYAEADEVQQFNNSLDELKTGVERSLAPSIIEYFTIVIENFPLNENFSPKATVGYIGDSRHLVVDYFLPDGKIVPDCSAYTYSKTTGLIQGKQLQERKKSALYSTAIVQTALAVMSLIFRADHEKAIDCLTLNGMIDTVDPATGQNLRTCLYSLRVTRDAFERLDLSRVDPARCMRELKASVSSAPNELVPVRPLLELKMTDARFIETTDVISTLDQRPNLMDLTPGEFEALITNLFAAMGLETRLTQASRDGGVDCVAFDQRPILGGKVVIQAKRYKNTVGVSAVRDLFGTVQNEGASKGILVTTSGYGKAAFDFATGKPLELLDGQNLLYLLAQHAKIEAKIVMPEE